MPYYFIVFSNYFRYFIEFSIAMAIFAFSLRKRNHFWLRMIISFGCSVVIIALFAMIVTLSRSRTILDIGFTIIAISPIIWLLLAFKDKIWNLTFCCVLGGTLRMVSDTVLFLAQFAVKYFSVKSGGGVLINANNNSAVYYVIKYSIFVIACTIAFFTIGRSLRKNESFSMGPTIVILHTFVFAMNYILVYTSAFIKNYSDFYYFIMLLCQLAYSMLIIVVHYIISRQVKAELNLHLTQQLMEMQRKQFEQQKNNVENINLKFHDLRHQLRDAQNSGKLDKNVKEDIMKTISAYNTKVETGNNALDIILTEKSLQCERKNVQFTCAVDGHKLAFMKDMEIYSVFGNAVENAMEYLETIENVENRFIFLSLKEKESFFSIVIENYFEGELQIIGDLPETSKQNKNLHGFGMKSIKQVVERHNGSMAVVIENNLFRLKIMIPIP